MSVDTAFYIVGSALAVMALAVSFLGLKLKDFPSRGQATGLVALFAAVVVATTGLAVAVARHEQDQRHAEEAEVAHQEEGSPEPTPSGGE